MVLTNQEGGPAALNWCALEIQAVYFSGKGMGLEEFRNIMNYEGKSLPFPSHTRRAGLPEQRAEAVDAPAADQGAYAAPVGQEDGGSR